MLKVLHAGFDAPSKLWASATRLAVLTHTKAGLRGAFGEKYDDGHSMGGFGRNFKKGSHGFCLFPVLACIPCTSTQVKQSGIPLPCCNGLVVIIIFAARISQAMIVRWRMLAICTCRMPLNVLSPRTTPLGIHIISNRS